MTSSLEEKDIQAFHERFKLYGPNRPMLLTDDLYRFRVKFMQEEINEFQLAHERNDLPKSADALIDLVYVAMGTAYLMGIPWRQIWNIVHFANMQKIRADETNRSKRSQAFDVVKPEGWVSPDEEIRNYLRSLGARC
jgi:predicted HAD superfamily Cof-like phosphohydrolase